MIDMMLENALSAIESEADSIGGEYHYVASRLCEAVESIRDHLAKAAQPGEATPYAYEYWVSNGDGTRSVEFGRRLPAYHCSDWGVKHLYETSPTIADYERAVTEQAMLTECVSVTARDPSDVILDVIQWHVSNTAQPVEAADIGVGRDIVKRLRDTPNWLKEAWGDFKSAGANKYDRAPKEAADYIETLLAALAHPRPTLMPEELDSELHARAPDEHHEIARAVWESMNRRSAPGVIMTMAYTAVLRVLSTRVPTGEQAGKEV